MAQSFGGTDDHKQRGANKVTKQYQIRRKIDGQFFRGDVSYRSKLTGQQQPRSPFSPTGKVYKTRQAALTAFGDPAHRVPHFVPATSNYETDYSQALLEHYGFEIVEYEVREIAAAPIA